MTIALVPFGTHALIKVGVHDQALTKAPLVDPSALTIRLFDPTGAEVAYVYGTDSELTRSAVGRYLLEVPVQISGVWLYQFVSVDPDGTGDGTFSVGLDPAA